MGSFWSTSVKQSVDVTGNDNNIWIIDGMKFNLSLILDQTIERMVDRFQNFVTANNRFIIVNMILISAVIIFAILFLHLKWQYQQRSAQISFNEHPFISSVTSSMPHEAPYSKNVSGSSRVYII